MNQTNTNKRPNSPYSYHFEDGLLDMFIGIIILQLGLTILFEQQGLFGDAAPAAAFLFCLAGYFAVFALWKRITLPRLSRTVHTPVKKKNFQFFFTFNIAFLLILLAAALVISHFFVPTTFFLETLLRILPMAIVLGVAAFVLELRRVFLYAALVVFAFPFGGYIALFSEVFLLYPLTVFAASLIILISGAVRLKTFLSSPKE